MGARGPHDDFESAEKTAREAFEHYGEHRDLDLIYETYVSDDVEYVTRHGTFHGPDQWLTEFKVQQTNFDFDFEVEEVVDAGEGAVILLNKVLRKDRESGEVVWKAWPAIVVRVLGGKIVFWEGYIDRRKALVDLGVEQD
jgi:ketosteroid isomerase-like protein